MVPTPQNESTADSAYVVTWTTTLDARDPYRAALRALRSLRTPDSLATVFEVAPGTTQAAPAVTIDLHVDLPPGALTPDEAVEVLRAAAWPSVAEDLADGVPVDVMRAQLVDEPDTEFAVAVLDAIAF